MIISEGAPELSGAKIYRDSQGDFWVIDGAGRLHFKNSSLEKADFSYDNSVARSPWVLNSPTTFEKAERAYGPMERVDASDL